MHLNTLLPTLPFFSLSIHRALPITLFFIGGILAQAIYSSTATATWLFIFCCLLIATKSTAMALRWQSYLPLALAVLCGAVSYQRQQLQHHVWQHFYDCKARLVTTIIDNKPPSQSQQGCCYVATIGSMTNNAISCSSSNKNILLYTPHVIKLSIGDTIAINDAILKIPNNKTLLPYFVKENIAGTVTIKNNAVTILDKPSYSLRRFIYNWRLAVLTRLKQKMPSTLFHYFGLIFLGNKAMPSRALQELKSKFKTWGISHFLARSGLHLVMVIMTWEFLLKFIFVPALIKHLALLLFMFIYFLLSWSSISFIRAFATLFYYKFCIIGQQQIHTMHVITIITLSVLLINPMQLFFLDFQLSFGITFLLAWTNYISQHYKQYSTPTTKITDNS